MNKKIITLVATLFVATSAQSFSHYQIDTINEKCPTVFPDSEYLAKHINGHTTSSSYADECKTQAQFERYVQTAVFGVFGTITAAVWGCIFAEWYQNFKVNKAEKALLIARLHLKAREEKAVVVCCVS